MNKYKIIINYESEVEAKDEEQAKAIFIMGIEQEPQQDLSDFIWENIKVEIKTK